MRTIEDLTAAARTVVQNVGIGSMTLAAVAREAGISRATMYRRFASRDELLSALIIAELDALENVVRGRLRFADQPRETIQMIVREVLDYNANNVMLQAALRIDGADLLPWLIRGPDRPTIVDIVTERVLAYVGQSPLAAHLSPTPESAVEFMVSAIYAELLSPARHLSHAQLSNYIADAVCVENLRA
ncbi:helix-turn-helix domain-containing protein [Gordonia sp. (in: high G+C Gram-positive bacteria)]|jgi:AcrR family transcriptional regulator|uniref:TetR/AcrR family transcriptional regulator n=1 Tax=Gordonia sp. (in: high G+C Gram-positive bacteria) TaxID=84139 RepID=UPI001E15448E|nr:helix-turn-helix domain-containing protein [Gordonia sp. (in: high G+C Gram-positive bacteria)]MCB1293602.1 TetR/AcrR family transcriptional regulator [Gordonia sp. (in: high G+C Gram-positive bacteria)]HMS76412.1 helix-turn-helix domain-containing protein [Gordonia sp. (in: high G+C Gram-positive bacteria)]HQV16837.1 helix-turn-helix domain-containing protein [Gordonia sp. (in: high G+C Gram-positive bacteria)]